MRNLVAVVLTLALAAIVKPQTDCWVEPKQQYDIEIKQTRLTENVYIENNTRLFMSTQITSLEEEPKVLQTHVKSGVTDVFPTISDDNLVGPQGSLLSGGWSTTLRYKAPYGKNAVATVITAGLMDGEEMTPEEYTLYKHLLGRTIFDQFFMPIANWACGVKFDKGASAFIAGAITGHGTQLIEQLQAIAKTGSPQDIAFAVWQFVIREIETSGPVASYIARKYGINLAEKMAERIAKRILINWIPGLNAVDKFILFVNTTGTAANLIPSSLDLFNTPAKLKFNLYFTPGLGAVYPGIIRLDGKDDEIYLHGHKLVPIPGKEFTVRAYDKVTGKFFELPNARPTQTGHSITFKLPESEVGTRRGPIRFDLLIDKQVLKCPGEVSIIQDLVVHRMVPDRGPPGTRVRILADGVYPYTITNTVLMQKPDELTPTRASVDLISKKWLEFTVPETLIVERDTAYNVFVEEKHGDKRRESRKIAFTIEPGTAKEREQKNRESAMPETKLTFEGTLDAANPARSHTFDVPAGMQVEAELLSVSGPATNLNAGELEFWTLNIVTSADGAPLRGAILNDPFTNVKSGQPAQRVTHTTQSEPGTNKYALALRKKSTEPVTYKFEVRLFRRDDALSGRDAGNRFENALPIRNNERLNSRLSTEQRRYREDLSDMYRVEGVADDMEIVVSVTGAPTTYPFRNREGTVRRVQLYCQSEDDPEPYPVAWHDTPLTFSEGSAQFVHSAVGNRRYFVEVIAGEANTEYWVEVRVRPAMPRPQPLQPIVSDFDQDDENWKVSGNFKTGTEAPDHHHFPLGGFIYASDARPEETVGPLDVMVAVDTTGSMGGSIQSVRDSTVKIIDELKRRSSSLQVGLVSFKDASSDGAAARTIVPLSANLEQSLAAVRGWTASGGGNDPPEDLLYALKGALQSQWRNKDPEGRKVARVVIFVTDVPPKVGANGADFDGSTVGSIGRLASSLGVRVYPVIVGANGDAFNTAEDLAFATGGKTLQLNNQAAVADALIQSCHAALEPSAPMYWEAPAKFLGDKRKYMGTNLSFRMYSFRPAFQAPAEPFSGDDVILEGAGMSLSMRSGIRPDSDLLKNDNWKWYVVPLDPRGNWIHTDNRKPATIKELSDVMASLTKLKIRADYYAGVEKIQLDDVRMGEHDELTDAGLDERGQELHTLLERWKQATETISVPIDRDWNSAEGDARIEKRFRDRMGAAGLSHCLYWSGNLTLTWTAYSTPGIKERGFQEVAKALGQAMDEVRKSGTATPGQITAVRRAFATWRGFATSVNAQLENLLRLGLEISAGEERLPTLSGPAYDTQNQAILSNRTKYDNATKGALLEADAVLNELDAIKFRS